MVTPQPAPASKGRVLIVDDDDAVRKAYHRVLSHAGFQVEAAPDAASAISLVLNGYDTIVSDIAMPGMDGIGFLRAVRAHDLDVPVILVTGSPTIDTAARAVELGAFRYLVKPIEMDALTQTVSQAVGMRRFARIKREAQAHLGPGGSPIGDLAGLEVRFVSALKLLWMAYQPVVSWPERRIIGYEALMRSNEPALPHPGAMLDAAERLGWLNELGRAVRDHTAKTISTLPAGMDMLVNLHSDDLLDEKLYSPDALLSRHAKRVILEITERASLDNIKDVRSRIAKLRELGFRIAVDDLGAGYAGLTSFAHLEPEVVKLDMSLVRDADKTPIKEHIIRSFAALCRDMKIRVIAEGVETAAERDVVAACGCDLIQGFFFAKPGKPFPEVSW